ncbi:MAG: LLM class flavin-dependent oxidoreductase, partial [Bdellovibrionales bacterium]|nr:LLM class flavin-dependent oxidoreductase [Bdellovibrionales bacterium]
VWADQLGFETAWVAETHLSCQVQKENPGAVVPEFKGEIGLNTDILQLAHQIFFRTKKIHVGSAIMNILCNGGPIAHAEAIKTFLTLHSLNPNESRRLNVGFAAGRFPFSNTPYGIVPRTRTEEVAWPIVKGKIFKEATEIFLRLLKNENLSSDDIAPQFLVRADFRSEEHWRKTQETHRQETGADQQIDSIPLAARWKFDKVGVIPFEAPMDLLDLTIGTHDPDTQELANEISATGVFNLSITPSDVIQKTHQKMQDLYQKQGRAWSRDLMPRTVLVFVNDDDGLTVEEQEAAAQAQAVKAVENYWKAMGNTIDQEKIDAAVDNSIYGSPQTVAHKIREKYHPEDRLMIWFDFNNHNNDEVKSMMETFMKKVVPLVNR